MRHHRRLPSPLGANSVSAPTPSLVVSHELPLTEAPGAYDKFDKRVDGYTKVLLHPAAA